MKCVALSRISNMVFSFAESFNRNLLGAFHTFSFLYSLAEHALALFSLFLAD